MNDPVFTANDNYNHGEEDDFVLDITYFELKWFEVIGNRFENPELLET